MTRTAEQHLLIVVHLLYPNSSQALDVYNTILALISKKKDNLYSEQLFKKLISLSSKTAIVRSSQPFQFFEKSKLHNWLHIYQKSSRQQLLAICGLIIFKFETEKLSRLLNTTEQKIKFLVTTAFKKTTQIGIATPAVKANFSYRKKADNQISYMFINENLVAHSLGILPEFEKIRVEQGLSFYKQLVPLQSYYKEIVEELDCLAKENYQNSYENFDPLLETASARRWTQIINTDSEFEIGHFLKKQKPAIAFSSITILFLALVITRPNWLQKISLNAKDNYIVMQEIQNRLHTDEENFDLKTEETALGAQQPSLPAPKISFNDALVGLITSNVINPQDFAMTTTPSRGIRNVAFSDERNEKSNRPLTVNGEHTQTLSEHKKVSGLYRATIVVTDLNSISSRITEKLVAFGAKKAGEVELGWKKTPALSYYHLILPEENLEAAKTFLSNFGKLNIQYEYHPRLLPAGTNRIILEVKESE